MSREQQINYLLKQLPKNTEEAYFNGFKDGLFTMFDIKEKEKDTSRAELEALQQQAYKRGWHDRAKCSDLEHPKESK